MRNERVPLDIVEYFEIRQSFLFEKVEPLYRKGLSISDIVGQTGYTRHAVWTSLKQYNKELRSQNPVPFEQWRKGRGKTNARPPYGYCFFDGEVIKDPKEYPTLQLIHSLWKQGQSISSIVRHLDGKKIKSRMKKPWSYNVAKSVIQRIESGSVNHLAPKKNLNNFPSGGKHELR